MLFAIVISFKAYKVKVQEREIYIYIYIYIKAFSLNKKSTLYSATECHCIKNKKLKNK